MNIDTYFSHTLPMCYKNSNNLMSSDMQGVWLDGINLEKNKNWMTELTSKQKSLPLNKLKLPGSHDSGAHKINYETSLKSVLAQENRWFKIACKLGGKIKLINKYITKWALANDRSVYDQLMLGIRYFDFRITYITDVGFIVSHAFMCERLNDVLFDIKCFLDNHEGESVVLHVKHDYNQRKSMNGQTLAVINCIKSGIGQYLYPQISEYPSLQDMTLTNKRVLCIYPHTNNVDIWSEDKFSAPWKDTSNIQEKLKAINQDFLQMESDYYNVISYELTPNSKDIWKSVLFGWTGFVKGRNGLRELARTMQAELNVTLEENNKDNLSVIKTDYPNSEFVEIIIKLNE